MGQAFAVAVGSVLLVSVLADVVNTLVATHSARQHLVDSLLAPRGFWRHEIGHKLDHHLHESEEVGE